MKLILSGIVLLFSSYIAAQGAPAAGAPVGPPKSAPAKAADADRSAPASMPADVPVVTIPGVCGPSPAVAAGCETTITRGQFEALVSAMSALRPGGVPSGMEGRIASQYGEMLVLANEAEKRGLEKDAGTQALLQFSRVQVLAQELLHSLQLESHPSAQEIQKYYDEHSADYQGLAVQRVLIPFGHGAEDKDSEKESLKALAEATRKRLAAGEDPAQLEQEIYKKLGYKKPPETSMLLRVTALEGEEQALAKLHAGEVSQVLAEPGGFVIYRSDGTKPAPLDSVHDEIQSVLEREKFKAATEALLKDRQPKLNQAYFGVAGRMGRSPHE